MLFAEQGNMNHTQSKPQKRHLSDNVKTLHSALTQLLNETDRAYFLHILSQYQKNRNVGSLTASLKGILNTPRKREIYWLLRKVIPSNDAEKFDRLWSLHGSHSLSTSPNTQRRTQESSVNVQRNPTSLSLPVRPYVSHHSENDSGIELSKKSNKVSKRKKAPLRELTLKRESSSHGFGFSIRGGSEHGIGIYVSSVSKDSVSGRQGLIAGDHILKVNDRSFEKISHAKAAKIIQHCKKLHIHARYIGRIPGAFVAETTYKWVDQRGHNVSPPPELDSSGGTGNKSKTQQKSDMRLLADDDERKVGLYIDDGSKLGLKIRGGADYGLGIYIAGVDTPSVASLARLKVGDQIIDVNGKSFVNISHREAVKILKSTRNMVVTLKDVGRLPYARTMTDKTKWLPGQEPTEKMNGHVSRKQGENDKKKNGHVDEPNSFFKHGIAGNNILYHAMATTNMSTNMIDEQARQLLSDNEHGTMRYYLTEYTKFNITVDAFVLALFDLLNSPAKVSLLSEIRGSILPKDIERFDDLVLKKEIAAIKAREQLYTMNSDDQQSICSFGSSASSISHGSISSSNRGSGDSRPITPPQVPMILPPNIMVKNDIGESMKEPEQVFSDEENEGLPTYIPEENDSFNLDMILIPTPREGFVPLMTSSPRRKDDVVVRDSCSEDSGVVDIKKAAIVRKTPAEITEYQSVGDNQRLDEIRDLTDNRTENIKDVSKSDFKDDLRLVLNGDSSHALEEGRNIIVEDDTKVKLMKHKTREKEYEEDDLSSTSKETSQYASRSSYENPIYSSVTDSTISGGSSDNTLNTSRISPNMTAMETAVLLNTSISEDTNLNKPIEKTVGKPSIAKKPNIPPKPEIQPRPKVTFCTEPPRKYSIVPSSWIEMQDSEQETNSDISTSSKESLSAYEEEIAQKNSDDYWTEQSVKCTTNVEVDNPVEAIPQSGSRRRSSLVFSMIHRFNGSNSDERDLELPADIHNLKYGKTERKTSSENGYVVENGMSKSVNKEVNGYGYIKEESLVENGRKSFAVTNGISSNGIKPPSVKLKSTPLPNNKPSIPSYKPQVSLKPIIGNLSTTASPPVSKKPLVTQKKPPAVPQKSLTSPKTHIQIISQSEDITPKPISSHSKTTSQTSQSKPLPPPKPLSLVKKGAVEMVVEVIKDCGNLGLAIEGGTDTTCKDIKIKNVKAGRYDANKSTQLREGQIILAVNGRTMVGVTNGIAVLTLRQTYSSADDKIELLVRSENPL